MKIILTTIAIFYLTFCEMLNYEEEKVKILNEKFVLHIETIKYDYVKKFINNCVAHLKKTDIDVPYSVAIAQACLETGYGKHLSGENNLFGIKDFKNGKSCNTNEFINGKMIRMKQPFRNFCDKSECFEFYGHKLNNDRYKINKMMDYKTATSILQRCGYATAPNYKTCLDDIISRYKLYILDEIQNDN